jgi:AraC-like DNA-binding protein
MILKDFKPSGHLDPWIKCYRIVHFSFGGDFKPPPKPYTPRPEQCLAFYPYDTEKVSYLSMDNIIQNVRVALIGQHNELTIREVGKEFLVIQVIFQPGGLYRLLGMPMHEIFNKYIDATLIFNNEVNLVNEQLYHAKDYTSMIHILNIFFQGKIHKNKIESSRVDSIINLSNQLTSISLDKMAKMSCYSSKQFERHFYTRTGVTPGYYQRLVRFDHAFRIKNLNNQWSWQDIAWECSYTDYQHLAKDYKEFTGYTPREFHLLGSPEESLGLAESFYEVENQNKIS